MSAIKTTLQIVAGIAAGVVVVEGFRAIAGINIDPSSDENIFKLGVDRAVQVFTDDKDETLGGALYEYFNDPYEPNAPADSAIARNLEHRIPTQSGKFIGFD